MKEGLRKVGSELMEPEIKALMEACKREGYIQKVKEEDSEGCNMHGFLEVNKVAGSFHFSPRKSFHQSGIYWRWHDNMPQVVIVSEYVRANHSGALSSLVHICVEYQGDEKDSNVHLGRLLEIPREFPTDAILIAYVIDDVLGLYEGYK
ncbi:hypothetical protein MKX01_026605, partial [Papaver californicum]